MFVRFRQSACRLQVSLVETRRLAGQVRHEHVASLGSIAVPPSVVDRVAYWEQLHQRLGRLSNRLDPETHAKILNAVHARIAMPTVDERRGLQLENAEADERFWSDLQGLNQDMVEGHKAVVVRAERAIADAQAGATQAEERAVAARDRTAQLKAGKDVVGVSTRPMTREDMIAAIGWGPREVRRATRLAAIGDTGFGEFLREVDVRHRRAEDAALNAVYRRHFPSPDGGKP